MERATALPLAFAPGANYTYSNNGYIALGAVIARASGMTYDDYLAAALFRPLGMNSTGQDNARDVFAGRASGYTTMDGERVHYDLQNIHNSWGAGSLHSTAPGSTAVTNAPVTVLLPWWPTLRTRAATGRAAASIDCDRRGTPNVRSIGPRDCPGLTRPAG